MTLFLFALAMGVVLTCAGAGADAPVCKDANVMRAGMERAVEAVTQGLKKLETKGLGKNELALVVDPGAQKMYLVRGGAVVKEYDVSTAAQGLGCLMDTYKTPVGTHRIKEKVGQGVKRGTIFKSRINTGRVARILEENIDTAEDAITSRIMWLEGQEQGVNKGQNSRGLVVDSHARFIYIHGTSEEGLIGRPASLGCIRMRNNDVMELFELLPSGTLVEILNRQYVADRDGA